jgi:hypothetical protein
MHAKKATWELHKAKQAKTATDQNVIIPGLIDDTCVEQLFKESLFDCDGTTRKAKPRMFERYAAKAGKFSATAGMFCANERESQYPLRKLDLGVPKAPAPDPEELKRDWARKRKLAACSKLYT